jgi:toxin ParE1/3/4
MGPLARRARARDSCCSQSLVIRLSNVARRDLQSILDYLEEKSLSPSIRGRFLVAFEQSCLMYERWPDIGKRIDMAAAHHRNIRQFAIRRFAKYLVFYRRIEGGIQIERVLHGMRDLPLLLDARDKP